MDKKRKQVILDSRVQSANLLSEKIRTRHPSSLKSFISASAIGYYGNTGREWTTEKSPKGSGFLADVTEQWEQASGQMETLNLRTVLIRIGIVLSEKGGALKEMERPVNFGIGAYLGNGQQYYSWIHIDDLCQMFIKAIEDENMHGVYNGVAPNPVTNKTLTRAIARAKGNLAIPAPTPAFVLKMMMGEMAEMVLDGSRVSSKRIQKAGFEFEFAHVEDALADIYS